jgi:cytosine deaminase
MLEVAFLASHLLWMTSAQDMETLYDMASTMAAGCMGVRDLRVEVGARADLVVLGVPSVLEALRSHAPPRYVISNGRVVYTNRMQTLATAPSNVGEHMAFSGAGS